MYFVLIGLTACSIQSQDSGLTNDLANGSARQSSGWTVGLDPAEIVDIEDRSGLERLVIGGGCFWCLEAVFELVPGVKAVESGYAGGTWLNPTYQDVTGGWTGHAEVVSLFFDPAETSLAWLFDLFFKIHDPTTPNRQGGDVGSQYRSIILYRGAEQREAARLAIARAATVFEKPVVTELTPLGDFWLAEDYHQNFFRLNPEYGYCRLVIVPKVGTALDFMATE
ncbi:MAG TPA: peptide-methionine (S)-S-oxide reductase [Spirochaetaceae bacterium]|nr:peptide-methionine (S)-S-oxide reductase [Spirochaetaceae bacterium]HAX37742.1 peptide-methionine (S)-S-oxide reductase [Spirochaetaceae bacterium]HBO41066.1 peptide-methionine (S)-S-oxide reductase [Spirochaetaceae bacterium]HCQ87357.1 peptide-methionine (S)-S-oxide reductase [Spirochaetaceae bacterium]